MTEHRLLMGLKRGAIAAFLLLTLASASLATAPRTHAAPSLHTGVSSQVTAPNLPCMPAPGQLAVSPGPDCTGGGCSYSNQVDSGNYYLWHSWLCADGPYYDYYGRKYYTYVGECWVTSAAWLQGTLAFTYKLGCTVNDTGANWNSGPRYGGPTTYYKNNTPAVVFDFVFGSYSAYHLPTNLYVDYIVNGTTLGSASGIWQIDCKCTNPTLVSEPPGNGSGSAHLYLS